MFIYVFTTSKLRYRVLYDRMINYVLRIIKKVGKLNIKVGLSIVITNYHRIFIEIGITRKEFDIFIKIILFVL
jgi:hypothetical protein